MQKTKSNILNDLDSVDRDYTPRRWRTYRRYTELLSRLIFCERKFRRKTISIISIYANSNHVYKEYYTIDWQHRSNIRSLRDMIKEYFKSSEIKRPLCFLIGGDPGSGKSHFVKSMANSIVNAKFVEDNLASFESFNSIATSVENVRNAKAHDLNPILFLDEADAYNKKYFNNLLPLMWDGKVFLEHRTLFLGKIVIFFAVSDRSLFNRKKLIKSENEQNDKSNDFLSRINGVDFNVPSLNHVNEEDKVDRRLDKILRALSLFEKRFKNKKIESVPLYLLRFIAHTDFEFTARSIGVFVDYVPADVIKNRLVIEAEEIESFLKKRMRFHILSIDGTIDILRKNLGIDDKTYIIFRKSKAEVIDGE